MLLALAGLIDTIIIEAVVHMGPGYCIGGSCDKVLLSGYAKPYGVSLSTIGTGFYAALFINALIYGFGSYRSALRLNLLLTSLGVVASGYLVYLQGWRIGAWCLYCLTSATIQLLLFLMTIGLIRADRPPDDARFRGRFGFKRYVAAYGLGGLTIAALILGQSALWKAMKPAAKKDDPIIASIGGKDYRLSDVIELRRAGYESGKLQYEGYARWYRNELLSREAVARGFDDGAAFLEADYAKAKREITDAELESRFRAMHSSDSVAVRPTNDERQTIKQQLEGENYSRFQSALMAELESKYSAKFLAQPPQPPIVDFRYDPTEAPLLGNPTAAIKIVEFGDLTCSHCRELAPHLRGLVESDQNGIAICYRHYFLGGETGAPMIAARAAVAAWKQGKFWEYVDQVFEEQGRGIRGDDTYVEIARRLGLDLERFQRDRQGNEAGAFLQRDLADAKRLGVTRTPTVYINGVLLEMDATPENVEEAVRKLKGR